jgi:hypothetical protein
LHTAREDFPCSLLEFEKRLAMEEAYPAHLAELRWRGCLPLPEVRVQSKLANWEGRFAGMRCLPLSSLRRCWDDS